MTLISRNFGIFRKIQTLFWFEIGLTVAVPVFLLTDIPFFADLARFLWRPCLIAKMTTIAINGKMAKSDHSA